MKNNAPPPTVLYRWWLGSRWFAGAVTARKDCVEVQLSPPDPTYEQRLTLTFNSGPHTTTELLGALKELVSVLEAAVDLAAPDEVTKP